LIETEVVLLTLFAELHRKHAAISTERLLPCAEMVLLYCDARLLRVHFVLRSRSLALVNHSRVEVGQKSWTQSGVLCIWETANVDKGLGEFPERQMVYAGCCAASHCTLRESFCRCEVHRHPGMHRGEGRGRHPLQIHHAKGTATPAGQIIGTS